MRTLLKAVGQRRTLLAGWLTTLLLLTTATLPQTPAVRITQQIDDSDRATIEGSHPPLAKAEKDTGRVPPGTKLQGVNIVFSHTAAQEADIQALIAAQQNPSSPLYHKWLTPDEFGARFGVADSDISKVESWLEQEGFSVDGVSRSKNRITFSGTVGQVETAFGTELHNYKVNGETHFAPSQDISVPVALASLVQTVANLADFRPKPYVRFRAPQRAPGAEFTSGQTGNHFLTPGDIATIYDIKPAYDNNYTGAGQSIAVVGQSSIGVSDIENFQSASGLTKKDPTLVLVPNSGAATVSSGDEAESDLDLEYSGAIAKGATVYFVYVGNNPSYSVWDAINHAVDSRTAPVISVSYGTCETELSSSDYTTLNRIFAQAAAQGQTVISASGDSGSTGCYGQQGLTTAQQQALAVDFPASSQYVTGMGGTEFLSADVASTNSTYWSPAHGSDVIGSALSYIPEQVWNDDSSSGLSSSGGGVSSLTARPSWQTGVTGIPAGAYRLIPDVSLTASAINAGFLYCSSDSAATNVTGSCSHGFRDSSDKYLTVAGGTSFDTPIFAGMLAILNQKLNSTGQGVINPTLYMLAADSATYASAFHDITNGSNKCTAGPTLCSSAGASEYSATTGFDQASGLGSVDFYNLLTAWPGGNSSSKTFELSATNATISAGSSGTSTITITPENGYTGTIAWTISSSPSLSNRCFSLADTTLSGSTAVTAAMTIHTNSSACASGALTGASGAKGMSVSAAPIASRKDGYPLSALTRVQANIALAGLLLTALLGFRSQRLGTIAGVFLLIAIGCAASGCCGYKSSSDTAKSTYTVTIVGKDVSSSSITASTTMTLTID